MAEKKTADNFKRYRFSVPNADKSVTDWIAAQSNLSYSIRELIKTAIRCNGYSDVSCYPVRQILMEMPAPVVPPEGGQQYPMEYALLQQAHGMPGMMPQQPPQPVQQPAQVYPPQAAPIYPGQAGQVYPQQPPQPVPGFTPQPSAPASAAPAPQQPAGTPAQTFADPVDILSSL